MNEMKKTQQSMYVFSFYMMFVVGTGFIFMPELVLNLLQLPLNGDSPVWARFTGMLASIIGFYYFMSAKSMKTPEFFKSSVYGRYYAAAFMISIFFIGELGPMVLLLAFTDLAAATWTLVSYNKEHNEQEQAIEQKTVLA